MSPRPPGCPCTSNSDCDGRCLARDSLEPCELTTAEFFFCANPPYGGCVCELDEEGPQLMCIELEECPEARPEDQASCNLVAIACYYDTPEHERCWCMNRFGQPVWECVREDTDCPYHQPTPGSACTGDIDCFYATASALAYSCSCTKSNWSCEPLEG